MTETMKALQFSERVPEGSTVSDFIRSDTLRLVEDVPVPEIGPSEVLIHVHRAAANYFDTLILEGKYQVRSKELPATLGSEAAGYVAAVGSEVQGLKEGDRVLAHGTHSVAGHGSFADFVAVPSWRVKKIPDHMDFDFAAGMIMGFGTSLWALKRVPGLGEGKTIIIPGITGTTGHAAAQLAKAMSATIIGGVGSEAKVEMAQATGADHVFVYGRDSDGYKAFRKQVLGICPDGVDYVFDQISGKLTDELVFSLRQIDGVLITVGMMDNDPNRFPLGRSLIRDIHHVGALYDNFAQTRPGQEKEHFDYLCGLHAQGEISTPITTFPLEDYAGVYDGLLDRSFQGKAIFVVND